MATDKVQELLNDLEGIKRIFDTTEYAHVIRLCNCISECVVSLARMGTYDSSKYSYCVKKIDEVQMVAHQTETFLKWVGAGHTPDQLMFVMEKVIMEMSGKYDLSDDVLSHWIFEMHKEFEKGKTKKAPQKETPERLFKLRATMWGNDMYCKMIEMKDELAAYKEKYGELE